MIRAILLCTVLTAHAAKWNLAFHHDEDDSTLLLRGIEFPSEQRGIAVGVLSGKSGATGVALVTADGGKSWTTVRLKEEPLSISCTSDETCWFASLKGIWRSEEGGRQWKKVSGARGIMHVRFVSPTHGWGSGLAHSLWESVDGGKTWKQDPASKAIPANPDWAVFTAMSFHGNLGIAGGTSRPPRRGDDDEVFPDWMVPEAASKRREVPSLMMLLETKDGGKNWSYTSSSMFGVLTQVRIRPDGLGAGALLEYFNSFAIPSELIWVDFRTGKSVSVFKDKGTAATDVWIGDGNTVTVAGVEAEGLRSLPVPRKVRFFETRMDSATATVSWTSIPADYRAVARRVALGRTPGGVFFAVTDTGMILRLDR